MKKKLIAAILAVVLVFGLSVTASAAKAGGSAQAGGGAPSSGAGLASAEKGAQLNARARVMSCLSVMAQNRTAILNSKAENAGLGNQLRTTLQEMKESGATLPQETLAALTELKAQLQAKHDELAATRGEINALMATYRELKRAGDLESAAAVLDQVIVIQQTRLQISTEIGSLLRQMIELLS